MKSSKYIYRCFDCSKEYDPENIEGDLIYLCPDCGEWGRNEPLKGVLTVEYDYQFIKSVINKDYILNLAPGRIWEYPDLLPLNSLGDLTASRHDLIKLNSSFVSSVEIDDFPLLIFDDSRNPTLSYKDRASILIALKAIQLGLTEIAAASTGNAGSSLAGICARLGLNSHVFVPHDIPESKRIQIQSFGSNIYCVEGDYDEAFDLCMEISSKKSWYNRNTGFNPLTIEGKKTSAFDMFIELGGILPDEIYVSAGDGVIVSGIFKGLRELKNLGMINYFPKLNIVQAEGSDAIVRFLESGNFVYRTANTLADSICAGAPRNLFMAADSVKNTGGEGIKVSDKEIINAQKLLALNGILCEPAAAASFAGFKKNTNNHIGNKKIMIMITGNGLKDTSSLKLWNQNPEKLTSEKWVKNLLET